MAVLRNTLLLYVRKSTLSLHCFRGSLQIMPTFFNIPLTSPFCVR